MSTNPTVYLLGDAILDNFYWLSDKKQDLRKDMMDLGFTVHNNAVDEAGVKEIINGITPNQLYVKNRPYPYHVHKDGKIYPLRSISSSINGNRPFTSIYENFSERGSKKNTHTDNMVVISMGGNDLKSKFASKFMGVLLGVENFMNSVITREFIANYKGVIESVRSNCKKIVLVSVYFPYLGVGSSYGLYSPVAKPAMDKWNNFICGIAKEYNIPVLDLSKTLDIGDRSHYGSEDTRISNISGKCIAKCLSHIYSNYDGHRIYYAEKCNASKITTV